MRALRWFSLDPAVRCSEKLQKLRLMECRCFLIGSVEVLVHNKRVYSHWHWVILNTYASTIHSEGEQNNLDETMSLPKLLFHLFFFFSPFFLECSIQHLHTSKHPVSKSAGNKLSPMLMESSSVTKSNQQTAVVTAYKTANIYKGKTCCF